MVGVCTAWCKETAHLFTTYLILPTTRQASFGVQGLTTVLQDSIHCPQHSVLEHCLSFSPEVNLKKRCLFSTHASLHFNKIGSREFFHKRIYNLRGKNVLPFFSVLFLVHVLRGKECHKLRDCIKIYAMHLVSFIKTTLTIIMNPYCRKGCLVFFH